MSGPISTAGALAKEYIKGAQDRQKQAYDKGATNHRYKVGDHVMIHVPATVSGPSWTALIMGPTELWV